MSSRSHRATPAAPDVEAVVQRGARGDGVVMTLAEIEARFLRAVDSCAGLVEDERLRCDRFLAMAGEPGVALENLRVQLVDEDAAVPRDLFAELVALGRAMGLNESYWSLLRQK